MTQTLEVTSRWGALDWIVTHNSRDLVEGRYELSSEIVSWFKSLEMFRETERELMIMKDPTPEDLAFHRSILALLIAEGERLRGRLEQSDVLDRKRTEFTAEDFVAALDHLYDTQAVWHGQITSERKKEILSAVFDGEGTRS